MIRLEIFIILGVFIGVGLTLFCQFVWRKFSEHREAQVIKKAQEAALKIRVDDASTEDLLVELSTRDSEEFLEKKAKKLNGR